jgi:predicted enzyme related to lactoylglutathione lyase
MSDGDGAPGGGVTGLGGVFFRARDPGELKAWYERVLGVPADDLMRSDGLVFGIFDADTDYFGPSGQGFMVNFRVASLEATLERLRAAGADVDHETQEQDGIGRFGWATDPEGNRFELWEPAEGI